MRERLLQWLVCPACGDKLTIEVTSWEGSEIVEGTLISTCGQIFPIINGVPRLLCGTIKNKLPELYPDFFHRYPGLIGNKPIFKENSWNERYSYS